MTKAGDGATAELASFLAPLCRDDSDSTQRLLSQANDALLDTLGCIVFGADLPWTLAAHRHALATGADGPSTIVGREPGASTTPAMAAFANGAAAHAFELDDVHEEAISHPGAVVVPAALAVAEAVGASGRDLLASIVAGYEAMGRTGIAVGPAGHMLAGFHPTSMSGVFGSVTSVAHLLGFDESELTSALGVAATLASGTMEFASSGGMTKRIHAGRAAEAGVTAAMLVADGFEGPTDGLAGTYGFCRVFSPQPAVHLLTERLGERWMIDEITIKPYAACSDIHPMIEAAQDLRSEHGWDPSEITDRIVRIEAEGPTKVATQNDLDGTTSVMAAQYSAQFNIAAALLFDPGSPATYAADRITDPAIGELQAKVVSITASPEFDATYAWKMGGRIKITLDDGTTVERAVHGQRGSMHDPLATSELNAKFATLTVGRTATNPTASAELVRALGADGSTADPSSLGAALARRHR